MLKNDMFKSEKKNILDLMDSTLMRLKDEFEKYAALYAVDFPCKAAFGLHRDHLTLNVS